MLNIGYVQNDVPFYNLPPRPPLSLDPVILCESANIEYFTQNLGFLRLILKGGGNATPDLLGASRFARHRMPVQPSIVGSFLVAAGRELAGMLSYDLTMLQQVLSMIRPE